ncbi:MAG: phosphotransacetylase family protein [Bacillota bacterium]|nr:MAG: phosphotransacetylase family protein [Bacillota bacterium]
MKSLFVMGQYGSGKTAICLAVALKMKERGLKVSYYKPVWTPAGITDTTDEDASLMKEILGLDADPESISPFTASPHYLARYEDPAHYRDAIREGFKKACRGADTVIVEGTNWPYVMMSLGLDAATLAREFGSTALLVSKVINDYSLDAALVVCRLVAMEKVPMAGVIFNNVPRTLLDKTRGVYGPALEKAGFRVLGSVPRSVELSAPTVAEFEEALAGEVLVGEEHLDRVVEDILIGAMTLESAHAYLRRATNKAVITGGDRADLALAALETSTSVLVLTGGLYPDVKVLARAAEKSVPVILVHYDTYTAAEKLHDVSRKIRPRDTEAIAVARRNLDQYCDWGAILRSVGVE